MTWICTVHKELKMLDPIPIIKSFYFSIGILNTSQQLDRFIMIPKRIFEYSVLATKEYSNTKIPYSF